MPLEFWISSLSFSDGTTVPLEPRSVTVLVGPNNAGKSLALREIAQSITVQPAHGVVPRTSVVSEVNAHIAGDEPALDAWLDEHAFSNPAKGLPEPQYARPNAGAVSLSQLRASWNYALQHRTAHLGQLGSFFVAHAGGEQRLQLAGSTGIYDLSNQPPTAPLQVLFEREDRERAVAEAVRSAFGVPITVNRVAGSTIHLHFGELDRDYGPPVVTNAEYRAAINALPHVQEQGDGVKSFVGLTLLLTSAEYPIVLVDEPEAFLHPPQARLLGRTLSAAVQSSNTQLVIATHSLDVLRGTLEATGVALTVIRIQRAGTISRISILPPDRVRSVWNDPLLRFSSALDGVFHSGVVVCEGDGDARFYDAALQSARHRTGQAEHTLLFTHCGGKARVPVIVDALKALEVPVRVICDVDVLREEQPLRRIVEALGGYWTDIEPDWRRLKASIDSDPCTNPAVADVRARLMQLLDESNELRLTESIQRRVRELTRVQDGWTALKRAGLTAVAPGDATATAHRLSENLRRVGLFVPAVGELEGWARELGGHGPGWVVEAMRRSVHEENSDLAAFVTSLDASLSSQHR